MPEKRRSKRLLLVVAVFVLLVLVDLAIYRQVTWVEMDLTPLEQFAATESYEALIERVGENEPDPDGFTFVALGDTRSNFELASEVLLRAAEESPAFILSNGDLGREGTVEEYLEYHLKLMQIIPEVPFIPAPGNHEKGPNRDFAPFKALYGDERFSFDYGGSRFIGINNGDRPKLGPLDLRYLRRELAKPGAKHKFVVMHQPPEFVEEAAGTTDVRGFAWNAKAFHELMIEYEVDHVIVGHVHAFATTVIDGVRYTISGGGGVGLSDAMGEEASVHHFLVVRVTPDGIKNAVVKLVDGEWTTAKIDSVAQ